MTPVTKAGPDKLEVEPAEGAGVPVSVARNMRLLL